MTKPKPKARCSTVKNRTHKKNPDMGIGLDEMEEILAENILVQEIAKMIDRYFSWRRSLRRGERRKK